jgi:hypothetical protein
MDGTVEIAQFKEGIARLSRALAHTAGHQLPVVRADLQRPCSRGSRCSSERLPAPFAARRHPERRAAGARAPALGETAGIRALDCDWRRAVQGIF